MVKFSVLKHFWKSVKALITGKLLTSKLQKDTNANLHLNPAADELPLYTDGFSSTMRALRDPFFSK